MESRLLPSIGVIYDAALTKGFQIGRHVSSLLFGQAEIRHVGLGLHRGRRLNPMNQSLRAIRKLAGDESPAGDLIQGGTHETPGVGYSWNFVARTTAELLYDRTAVLRRSGERNGRGMELLAPLASGEQPGSSENQAQNDGARLHMGIRCRFLMKLFSQMFWLTIRNGSPLRKLCLIQENIQRSVVLKIFPGAFFRRRGPGWAPVFALFLFSAVCFSQQAPSSIPDGKQIFSQQCAKCHGERGEGVSAAVTYAGPSLQAEHNAGRVMTALEVGPEHMPQFEYILSGDQMRAVSQYVVQKLAVIPLSGGNVSEGGELYRTYCGSCHRTDVRGGALGFVGTNAPSLESKSAALVAGAIRWGPGPMPSFPPTVLNNQQVASIVDYVMTVQHPASPGGSPMNWYGPVAEGFATWVIVLLLILFSMWVERGGQG